MAAASSDIRSLRNPAAMCCESWEFRKICEEGSVFPNALLVADIDGDQVDEFVIGTTEGHLVVMTHDQRNAQFSALLSATISVVLFAVQRRVLVVITLEGQCEIRSAPTPAQIGKGGGGGGVPTKGQSPDQQSPLTSTAPPLAVTSSLTIPANCTCGDLDASGRLLFLGSSDRRVYVYDLIDKTCIGSVFLNSQVFAVRSCSILPTVPLLLIGSTTDLVILDADPTTLHTWTATKVVVAQQHVNAEDASNPHTDATATDDDAPVLVPPWAFHFQRDVDCPQQRGDDERRLLGRKVTKRMLRSASTSAHQSFVQASSSRLTPLSPLPPQQQRQQQPPPASGSNNLLSSGGGAAAVATPLGGGGANRPVRLPVAIDWLSLSDGRANIVVLSEDGYMWLFHLWADGLCLADPDAEHILVGGDRNDCAATSPSARSPSNARRTPTALSIVNMWKHVASVRLFRSMIQRITLLQMLDDTVLVVALASDGSCFMVDSARNVSTTQLRPDVCTFAALQRSESVLVVCLSVDEVVEYIVTPADPQEPSGASLVAWDSCEQDVLLRLAEALFPVETKANADMAIKKVEMLCLHGLTDDQWAALSRGEECT